MNYEQITGIIRAVLPAVLAYAVAKGWIAESSVGDIVAAAVAVGAAVWSVLTHTSARTVATVAAMDSTRVTSDGKTITLLKPELVEAARASATPPKN